MVRHASVVTLKSQSTRCAIVHLPSDTLWTFDANKSYFFLKLLYFGQVMVEKQHAEISKECGVFTSQLEMRQRRARTKR